MLNLREFLILKVTKEKNNIELPPFWKFRQRKEALRNWKPLNWQQIGKTMSIQYPEVYKNRCSSLSEIQQLVLDDYNRIITLELLNKVPFDQFKDIIYTVSNKGLEYINSNRNRFEKV